MVKITESQLRSLIRTELKRTLNEMEGSLTPLTVDDLLKNIKQFTKGGLSVAAHGESDARKAGGVLPEETYRKAFELLEIRMRQLNISNKKIVVYGPSYRDQMEVTKTAGYEYDVYVYYSPDKISRIISLPQEMKEPLHLKVTKITT